MENTKNIIELKHITKTYEDGFTAVSDFNLEVKQGERVHYISRTIRMRQDNDAPHDRRI